MDPLKISLLKCTTASEILVTHRTTFLCLSLVQRRVTTPALYHVFMIYPSTKLDHEFMVQSRGGQSSLWRQLWNTRRRMRSNNLYIIKGKFDILILAPTLKIKIG